ncbi:marR family protein [Burkholderia thailandensis 34]|uniref:MarR family winged helix-turn-helix transcriptional regulator n=1 Tax=Burkholderia thailandensis TaxID=57975 RepID=UPI0005D88F21|nr:MarR family transcriptional regulator [Burkholderia thailandensis]AJY28008.1 marR family protein [Burkholderia thailandensis 34]AOJ55591.1 MarR family transcriptional regulator [Burkholderia thailandensis]KXF60407.1 MarR family transcriptional regulator [Burkholderia thailandensis]PNE75538.1 MarR family transcriptional regulator [Burkholderia thailandensis]
MRLLCHCGTLRQATRAITSLYDAHLAKHGIRVTQFTILAALHACGTLPTGELATRLLLDQTTLSRTLATLQSNQLVRAESGDDQRVRLWSLTPKGTALFKASRADWEAAQNDVYRRVGKRNMQALDAEIFALAEALSN